MYPLPPYQLTMTWTPSISINNQVAEALQQLRDIHEPAIPGWWPIPIGWWAVLGILVAMLAVFVWVAIAETRKRAPYTAIRKAALRLNSIRNEGQIDAREYATRVNLLFKELVIRIEGQQEAATLHGSNWLEFLAERFDEREFIDGVGRCLGSSRYLSGPFSDEGLQELIDKTLTRVSPIKVQKDA